MNNLEDFFTWVLAHECEEKVVIHNDKCTAAAAEQRSSKTRKDEGQGIPDDDDEHSSCINSMIYEEHNVPNLHHPPMTVLSPSQTNVCGPFDVLPVVVSNKAVSFEEMNDHEEDEEGRLPSLCSCDSESSFLLDEYCDEPSTGSSNDVCYSQRRLTFNPHVEVREYSLTVGDHPNCNGSLPLSLDWKHAPCYYTDISKSRDRKWYYEAPPRLDLKLRVSRLLECSDLDLDSIEALINDGERSYLYRGTQMLLGLVRRSYSTRTVNEQVLEDGRDERSL